MNVNLFSGMSHDKVMKFEKTTKIVGMLAIILEFLSLVYIVVNFHMLGYFEMINDAIANNQMVSDTMSAKEYLINIIITLIIYELGKIAVLVIWEIGITKKNISDKWLFTAVWGFLTINVIYSLWSASSYLINNVFTLLFIVVFIIVLIFATVMPDNKQKLQLPIGIMMVVYLGKFMYALVNAIAHLCHSRIADYSDIPLIIISGYVQPLLTLATMIMFMIWILFLKDSSDQDAPAESDQ